MAMIQVGVSVHIGGDDVDDLLVAVAGEVQRERDLRRRSPGSRPVSRNTMIGSWKSSGVGIHSATSSANGTYSPMWLSTEHGTSPYSRTMCTTSGR